MNYLGQVREVAVEDDRGCQCEECDNERHRPDAVAEQQRQDTPGLDDDRDKSANGRER
jgi:hypothetical protein